MSKIAFELAETALELGAIRLRPTDPFTWASGYRMPIYNDNRLFLGSYVHRSLIAEGFLQIVESRQLGPDVIGGTATAGISFGTTVADRLQLPFIIARPKAKALGLGRQVEGVLNAGESVVLIEDLISTGGSSLEALNGIRDACGKIDTCLSIFSYGFAEAHESFAAIGARYFPLFTIDTLLEVALEKRKISSEEAQLIEEWRKAPFAWGEAHGFPRVAK